jgi:hypothetical protein
MIAASAETGTASAEKMAMDARMPGFRASPTVMAMSLMTDHARRSSDAVVVQRICASRVR